MIKDSLHHDKLMIRFVGSAMLDQQLIPCC